jgi:ribosomal protein S18 acetylase RimI-like enzyme
MIEIEKCSFENLEVVKKIAYLTWPTCYKNIISKGQIEYMLDMIYSMNALEKQVTEKNHHFILAKEKGNYIGFASFELNAEPKKTKLHKLYVLPDIQGKNVGSSLLSFIEKDATKELQQAIFLNVNKMNTAIGFYKRHGFSITKEVIIDIGNGFVMDDFIMQKELV